MRREIFGIRPIILTCSGGSILGTGKITQYPFPHSENTIREFFLDTEGRMWYGSPSNNKVGYFYLTDGESGSARTQQTKGVPLANDARSLVSP